MLHLMPSTAELQALVAGRAATDIAFRQQVLAKPRATLEQTLGVTVPPEIEVVVVEETASRICLVLPPRLIAEGELDDAQLDKVAGGFTPIPLPMPAEMPDPMPMPSNLPGPMPMPAVRGSRRF